MPSAAASACTVTFTGKGGAVEGKDARLRLDAHSDCRGDDERLIDAAGAGDALEGLHHEAEANGQAVKGKLRPGGKRPGSEGAIAPGLVGDVVVRLLDVGAGKEGRSGRGVLRNLHVEEAVADGGCVSALSIGGGADVLGFPRWAALTLEPDAREGGCTGGVCGMNADAEILAGKDAARRFICACAAEAGATAVVAACGGEGGEIEAEQIFKRGLELIDFCGEFEFEIGF